MMTICQKFEPCEAPLGKDEPKPARWIVLCQLKMYRLAEFEPLRGNPGQHRLGAQLDARAALVDIDHPAFERLADAVP